MRFLRETLRPLSVVTRHCVLSRADNNGDNSLCGVERCVLFFGRQIKWCLLACLLHHLNLPLLTGLGLYAPVDLPAPPGEAPPAVASLRSANANANTVSSSSTTCAGGATRRQAAGCSAGAAWQCYVPGSASGARR